ncbi:MAG: hypothetical protein Q8N52_14350, partial [Acidobacteriota bacterium]|nr:hypothetical protein [Acidobacteriota bacterium]
MMTGRLASTGATLAAIITMSAGLSADSMEAILQAKTVDGFNRYAAAIAARIDNELRDDSPFLDIERLPAAQL